MSDGIRSAKLKLARASRHFQAIKRRIAVYAASKPHKVTAKSKGKQKLNVPKSPPREISLLAGEMVYQMRSALDHLTFSLIGLNPNVATIDPDWREHCQFPLRTRIPKHSAPPLARSKFRDDLPGISDKPFAFIESVQPYYRTSMVHTALRLLVHLSNIDKHRHLNLIRPRVRRHESVRFFSGATSSGFTTLERGAEIDSPSGPCGWDDKDRPVYVNRRYHTFVAFKDSELGGASGLPIDHMLDFILQQINTVIVPEFEKFIKNP